MAKQGTQRPEEFETADARGVLAEYERYKHAIAQILREIRAAAYQAKNENLQRSANDVTHKLAEDRFYLTVVGQFSRGKSTLMNAILGKDYLPSGIVPTTSAITAVSYGSRERVVLRRVASNLTSEIGIAQLGDFVTERINLGNRDRIEMAEVQVPIEILQRGFFLVDTPGLGSAVRENTVTTLDFLPSADAIVFVTSCDAPLTAGELGYLRECRSSVRQMFLVINKMDLVSSAERRQVLEFVGTKVREEWDQANAALYPVSARDGLAARMSGDSGKLRESGVPQLEEAIVNYITARKQSDFLLQICDRAADLLSASRVEQGEVLSARLGSLRMEIAKATGSSPESGNRAILKSAGRGTSFLGVSCAVCDRVVASVLDFLRQYQYDLYVSADVQRSHAEVGGFCPMHTWQYASLASPQGICSAYPRTLLRFSHDLLSLAEGNSAKYINDGVIGPPLPADATCPACVKAREAEQRAVTELAGRLEAEPADGKIAERRFCLTHLEEMLLALHTSSSARELLEREGETLRRIAENLQRYALRHEGRRSDLITEEEWQAPNQALTLLAGHHSVQPHFGR
jgi:GTP-binding protein EngB required for normal cell division